MDDVTLYPGQTRFPELAGFDTPQVILEFNPRASAESRFYAIDVSGVLADGDMLTGALDLSPRPVGDVQFSNVALTGNVVSFYATGGRPGVDYMLALSGKGVVTGDFSLTVKMPVSEAAFAQPTLGLSPTITPLTDAAGNILTDASGNEIGSGAESPDQHYSDVVTLDTGIINIQTPGFAGGNF